MTPGFKTSLQVERLENGRWKLLQPLIYVSAIPEVWYVSVPTGFDTDFASVPRLPLMFWLLGDRADYASTVHDYLYRIGRVSRRLADATFYEACRAEGVDLPSSFMFWLGVRVGGWTRYSGKHPDNQ